MFDHSPKTWGAEDLLSSDLNDELADLSAGIQATWDTYTVTRRNGSGGSTLTNGSGGTIEGFCRQIGNTWDFQIECVLGSTPQVGTTFWSFNLPATPASFAAGWAYYYDDTNSKRFPCIFDRINLSSDRVFLSDFEGTQVGGAAVPITWAADDRVVLGGRFWV